MASLWNRLIAPAQNRFRHKRALRILHHCPQIVGAHVVDVGGSLSFWKEMQNVLKPRSVICYNIDQNRMHMGTAAENDTVRARIYDGKVIPEKNLSADVVICNSVIEHVPIYMRKQIANEIIRVGRSYVIQTPSPDFPIELHFGLPFVHWMPRSLGRKFVRFSPFHLLSGADGPTYFDETQLLDQAELQALFPDGELVVEKAFSFPKSYLVFGQNKDSIGSCD